MSNSAFQVGDLVIHKSAKEQSDPLKMTVHSFVDDMGKTTDSSTDRVFCKWYIDNDQSYKQELFHIKELEKI